MTWLMSQYVLAAQTWPVEDVTGESVCCSCRDLTCWWRDGESVCCSCTDVTCWWRDGESVCCSCTDGTCGCHGWWRHWWASMLVCPFVRRCVCLSSLTSSPLCVPPSLHLPVSRDLSVVLCLSVCPFVVVFGCLSFLPSLVYLAETTANSGS